MKTRNAFTLVEMLVAVALVVLMMTLFTMIFQMATGSLAKQKALAEGDQRVRLVLTLLRGDLNNRTFQEVTPYSPTEDYGNTTLLNATQRRGYFYIAENNPNDDTDDVLGLTVSVAASDDRYFGAAKRILSDGGGVYGPSNPPVPDPYNAPGGVYYWPNQPEFDDQVIAYPDKSASSSAAEVVWWLRNGTLYRRVVLLRDPEIGVPPLVNDYAPTDYPSGAASLSMAQYEAGGTDNFYTDFDYSAFLQAGALRFHGIDDLSNTLGGGVFQLGNPGVRFGFAFNPALPREFMQDTGGAWHFIGRYTQGETSYLNTAAATITAFGYPGRINAASPDPYTSTALTYDTVAGNVSQYSTGTRSRVGEDIVMTNVLRFDIKVFDDTATLGIDDEEGVKFVNDDGVGIADDPLELGWPGSDDGGFFDLGHPGAGVYSAAAMNNATFCPNHPTTGIPMYRFDTWHPSADIDVDGTVDQPPFRAPDLNASSHRPMRAVQIHITFFDVTSQTERDVTFVQSLKPQ